MESDQSCEDIKILLSAYYDNELSNEENKLVKDHLNQCRECTQELKNLKKLSQIIKSSAKNIEDSLENFDLYSRIESYLDNLHICREINEKLSPYLDKELTKDELIEVSEHLLVCKFCRRDYESLKLTQKLTKEYFNKEKIQNYSGIKISPELIALQAHKQEHTRYLFGAFAAVIFLILLTWFSVNTVEFNFIKEATRNNYEKINQDKPLYVNAEDFLLKTAYAIPAEGALLAIYEE